MKKFLILSLLALLGMSQAVAQDYAYVPFVREGVKWACRSNYFNPQSKFYLELKGDTEINGKTYKVMHKYSGEEIDRENDTVPVYLREEDKIVYGIVPDGKVYEDCLIGFDRDEGIQEKIAAGEEFVLYDFNDAEGFINQWNEIPYDIPTVIPDMTTVGGRLAKRYISKWDDEFCSIEGIGYDGLYYNWYTLGNRNYLCVLDSVIENGRTIYRSERFKGVRPGRMNEDLLPLTREGVQWVNERVVIDHGVMTSEYYTYEFRGTGVHGYPIIYSYTGDSLDVNQAELAALFQGSYGGGRMDNPIYNNKLFRRVKEQGRDMIAFSYNTPNYRFACTWADIEFTSPVNYYITLQKEDFLNRANFFEVEPLEIEGFVCRRYAHVDEHGDVVFYYVEGIGFDSRDMGDLLTPFTRKPDPDAEYQEYWGLSHVVKDGKIIYKGMRYNPALFEKRGDVNGDGNVTIADVSALIDMLIDVKIGAGGSSYSCDVNGDSNVSIADVSALIDMLLVQP